MTDTDGVVACGVTTLLKPRGGVDGPGSGRYEFVATCTRLIGHEGEHEHYAIGGSVRWRAEGMTDGDAPEPDGGSS